ncbi:Holliday junction branch migration DNA helicase RuvB [Pasteuria penetrans]|uniref:Holliday junction branch migration DNA helicase RuvB n=1 Tax=Pasteuria penetrans TaxID=86005 RepID=UPI000FAF7902|nr:Holliday junction branch migration DNA helicase RuvB [Pasteuria penetrans]
MHSQVEGELSPSSHENTDSIERSLRPRTLAAYIGQTQVKENLEIYIAAARKRGEALDHVLLHGPPGLGKTTLARIIAQELGVQINVTSGPAMDRPGDLAAMLTNLQNHDVLFIDEIHRLPRTSTEVLYPAMEDFALDIVLGKGPGARSVRLDLPSFTLVGATTRMGSLTSPFRDRFGIVHRLEPYTLTDLGTILHRSAALLEVSVESSGVDLIAKRSRGTPRIANRLLRRVRDFVQVQGHAMLDGGVAEQALNQMQVDPLGLDTVDRRLLLLLRDRFSCGPVGVATVAAAMGEEIGTLEEVYEPYLLQIGLLERTLRGRRLTGKGLRYLEGADDGDPYPS